MERKWAHESLNMEEVEKFARDYMDFLNNAKTEREAVKYIIELAEKHGFREINSVERLSCGDRVYCVLKGKAAILAVIGEEEPKKGMRIIGAHIDAPRLDIKPIPLYEDGGIALFKTHYYGGVKKYQWVNIPLAIHGVVALRDGRTVEVVIGEKEDDPVFVIPDILPHLGKKKQESRKGTEVVTAEELCIVVGNSPVSGNKDAKDRVKKRVLEVLKEKYGITEEDLISADLEVVPAVKAKESGIDGSLIAGYGQDDRACVYTALRAILNIQDIKYTCVAIFVDREEIGSQGISSAQSKFIDLFIAKVLEKYYGSVREADLLETYFNSRAISADVSSVLHPLHKDLHDDANAAMLGKGVVLVKYTGKGGKFGSSEARAEYMAWIRKILDKREIPWQSGLLGKVDVGGGGTIAIFFAERGIEVVDMGPGVLGMHSPYELTSKADIYATYLSYKAFYEEE